MILIPALDLKNNFCVRLIKGDIKNYNLYSKNPLKVIIDLYLYNIKRFHIVDLNAAFLGTPKNLIIIKYIINSFFKLNLNLKLQLGGGIRNYDCIKYYFDIGISYIVISTKAVLDLNFLDKLCYLYKNKIILGLDLKNNNIHVSGWLNYKHSLKLTDFLNEIKKIQLESIICTDINKDGLLSGLNFNLFSNISKLLNKPLIISGGLYNKIDILDMFNYLKIYKNISGVICGKSIYTGDLNIKNIFDKINYFNNIVRN